MQGCLEDLLHFGRDWAGLAGADFTIIELDYRRNFGSGAGISTPFTLSVDPQALEALIKNMVATTGQTAAARYYWQGAFKIKENTEAGYLMAKFGGARVDGKIVSEAVKKQLAAGS